MKVWKGSDRHPDSRTSPLRRTRKRSASSPSEPASWVATSARPPASRSCCEPPVDAASPVVVHRVERFVQDRRSRRSDPGGRQENAAALSSGQLPHGELRLGFEVRFGQDLVDLLHRLRSQAADEAQNLADRRERRHIGFLGNERQVGAGRDFSPPQVGTVHQDPSGIRFLHSGRQLEQCRLAGAVLA